MLGPFRVAVVAAGQQPLPRGVIAGPFRVLSCADAEVFESRLASVHCGLVVDAGVQLAAGSPSLLRLAVEATQVPIVWRLGVRARFRTSPDIPAAAELVYADDDPAELRLVLLGQALRMALRESVQAMHHVSGHLKRLLTLSAWQPCPSAFLKTACARARVSRRTVNRQYGSLLPLCRELRLEDFHERLVAFRYLARRRSSRTWEETAQLCGVKYAWLHDAVQRVTGSVPGELRPDSLEALVLAGLDDLLTRLAAARPISG